MGMVRDDDDLSQMLAFVGMAHNDNELHTDECLNLMAGHQVMMILHYYDDDYLPDLIGMAKDDDEMIIKDLTVSPMWIG